MENRRSIRVTVSCGEQILHFKSTKIGFLFGFFTEETGGGHSKFLVATWFEHMYCRNGILNQFDAFEELLALPSL